MNRWFFNEILYSDVNPYEVVSMDEKKAVIKRMKAERVPCHYVLQDGEYSRTQFGYEGQPVTWLIKSDSENEHTITITKRKDGRWYQKGLPSGKNEVYYSPSETPNYYYDYSF